MKRQRESVSNFLTELQFVDVGDDDDWLAADVSPLDLVFTKGDCCDDGMVEEQHELLSTQILWSLPVDGESVSCIVSSFSPLCDAASMGDMPDVFDFLFDDNSGVAVPPPLTLSC